MWSETAYTGVYLSTRSPMKSIPCNLTPAEIGFGMKPNLEKVRVFICNAFAWIRDVKFDEMRFSYATKPDETLITFLVTEQFLTFLFIHMSFKPAT